MTGDRFCLLFAALAVALLAGGARPLCAQSQPSERTSRGQDPSAAPRSEAAGESAAQLEAAAPSGDSGAEAVAAAAAPASDSASTPERFNQEGRAFIAHLPKSTARVGDVPLRFDVRGADLAGKVLVRYRALDAAPGSGVREVAVVRGNGGYGVVLPLADARPPGVAYWIVERLDDGSERAVFASEQDPQPLILSYDAVQERHQRLITHVEGRRSTIGASFELVSLGAWNAVDGEPEPDPDRYYRAELQYAYRFFRVIDELRVGVGKLEADVLEQPGAGLLPGDACGDQRMCLGLEYGRAEVVLSFSDMVRGRGGVLLGFSDLGFAYGLRGGILLGDRRHMELDLGADFVNTIYEGDSETMGLGAGVRLGWMTVPRLPMGASITVTNFPTGGDPGVWLKLDVGYEIYPGALIKLVGGYRGRTSLAGGPSLGASADFGF